MRSAIRVSMLLIALGGCLGLVTAQRSATVNESAALGSAAAIADDDDGEVTGSIHLASVPRLSLTDEQRGFVFLGVINLPDIPDAALAVTESGAPLDGRVELHEIPRMVVRRIPQVGGYRFVKLEDRILLVNADTRQVEATIPRYKLVLH
ncbi:MAG: hypothetical protein IT536_17080 [Hyphomicrobiales bacterium]|nr:hypothetical protein [Hyphomicrobiales bacterium]